MAISLRRRLLKPGTEQNDRRTFRPVSPTKMLNVCRCIDNRAYPVMLYYVIIAMEQYFTLLGVKEVDWVWQCDQYRYCTVASCMKWFDKQCENIDQSILEDPHYA